MTDQNQEPGKAPENNLAHEAEQEVAKGMEQNATDPEPGKHCESAEIRDNNTATTDQKDIPEIKDIWPQLRQLLVFQIKLYIDAARDLLMSPLSVVVFIIDAVQGNRGEKSLFESLLQFGRRTEKAINLFNQHDINDENHKGIDSILLQVEEAVRKEYTDGSVSTNARDSIEKSLDKLRSKLNQSKQEDE